jgi:hypothetical protein
MNPPRQLPRFTLPTLLLVAGVSWTWAQVELPPLRTSRPALERPQSFEPARTPTTTLNSRSSSRGTSRIPDPTLFDGSGYPEEERPEQAMIAQFENPGGEPPPTTKDEQGPGEQRGGGGQGPGGDGGPPGGGGGQTQGPQIAGLPPVMGGGGGGEEGEDGQGQGPIPESQMGDQSGTGEGQEGEPGEAGAAGAAEAPQVAEGQQGRALEKPSEVQIGNEDAKLAEAQLPQAEASRQLENEQGETRMSVEAAAGSQPANRGRGTERGVDIPSNL